MLKPVIFFKGDEQPSRERGGTPQLSASPCLNGGLQRARIVIEFVHRPLVILAGATVKKLPSLLNCVKDPRTEIPLHDVQEIVRRSRTLGESVEDFENRPGGTFIRLCSRA